MKLLSYDIEIATDLLEGEANNFSEMIPSVAALAETESFDSVKYYWDKPYMSKDTAIRFVTDIMDYCNEGYTLFGWNILSFDLNLISHYSGMVEECGRIALNSCDPMFIISCMKGHFLGLNTALVGMGIEEKIHSVKLNDGTMVDDMDGSKAPAMWRSGEYEAVMDYLAGDVIRPLQLARAIEKEGGIRWTSKSGKPQFVKTSLLTVKECLSLPMPDVSWMKFAAKPREDFYSWIPKNILREENIA